MNTNDNAARYSSCTLVGNWFEDLKLKEEQMKKYLERKDKGTLTINRIQRNMQGSLKHAKLTESDGFMRFGDHVMLYSLGSEGVLSTDLTDRDSGNIEAYAVTTSRLSKGPVSRNVFVIQPAKDDNKTKVGDLLRFGMPFTIQVNPQLSSKDLRLTSFPLNPMQYSKISRQQIVLMSKDNSKDTLFMAVFKHISKRYEMEGEPIPVHTEVVIHHKRSGKSLYSESHPYPNDFGVEYEVSCFTQASAKRKQILKHEKAGTLTSQSSSKVEQKGNYWAFLALKQDKQEGSKS